MFCIIVVNLFISAFRLSLLFPPFNLHARFLIILRGYLLRHDSALFRIFIVLRSDFLGAVILIGAPFLFTRGKGLNLPWKFLPTFFADLSLAVSCRLIRSGETIFLLQIVRRHRPITLGYGKTGFLIQVILPHKSFVEIGNIFCNVFSSLGACCLDFNFFLTRAVWDSWYYIWVIGYILYDVVFSVVDQCHAMTW